MGPSDLAAALKALIPTRRPTYLWASPGVGKSSIVRQVASELGVQLIDIRATLLDPVDLRGLPRVEGDQAKWCAPAFLPTDGEGILFLDELAQAPPLVQSSCLQLTLDRRIGEYVLPDGWTVVAASNRQEDRAGTHRLISPLLNRFIHLDMDVSLDDWQTWAVQRGIAPEVRAFLRFKPGLLFNFDPSTNPRAFPTPRSWQFVSDVLPHTPKALSHQVVAGCVGEGPAAEFVGFLKLYSTLPDLDAVLANPDRSAIPTEPSVVCALIPALVEKVRKDRNKASNFVKYVTRMGDEYGMLGLRDLLAVDGKLAANPLVGSWVAEARKKGLFDAVVR
jgi:hypothetical protein